MLPCTFLLLLIRNAIIEYRRGRLGKSHSTLYDETISAVIQPAPVIEEKIDGDFDAKVHG